MAAAARDAGVTLRVMENYLFYEPLRRLKALVDEGELGEVAGYHLKMVASGRGGWEVPWENYLAAVRAHREGTRRPALRRRLAQDLDGAVAVRPDPRGPGLGRHDRGPPRDARRRALDRRLGARERDPRRVGRDARGRPVPALGLLHERRALGGHRPRAGSRASTAARAAGLQQPSLEVYRDGELHQFHALDDDWASSFAASGRHWIQLPPHRARAAVVGTRTRRSTCCASRWRSPRAARAAASASTRLDRSADARASHGRARSRTTLAHGGRVARGEHRRRGCHGPSRSPTGPPTSTSSTRATSRIPSAIWDELRATCPVATHRRGGAGRGCPRATPTSPPSRTTPRRSARATSPSSPPSRTRRRGGPPPLRAAPDHVGPAAAHLDATAAAPVVLAPARRGVRGAHAEGLHVAHRRLRRRGPRRRRRRTTPSRSPSG